MKSILTSPSPKCPISGQTHHEEWFNYLSHLTGALLSLIGLVMLLRYGLLTDRWQFTGCLIYSFSLILLYAVSTLYHGSKNRVYKKIFRIVDHCCIYLLIAGTYAPYMLGPLRTFGGWTMLAVEGSLALVGMGLKIFYFEQAHKISLILYLLMGWLILFNLSALTAQVAGLSIFWMALGGLVYSLGIIFFVWEKLPYSHGIWHLFVLAGSGCHYYSIFEMVQALTLYQ